MKILILLVITSSISWGRSIVPERIVTPSIDLYNRSNKILPTGEVQLKVTTYSKRGAFIQNGSKTTVTREVYDNMRMTSDAVLEMIPKQSNLEPRRGTAFSIGNNLVLTNNHVLDPTFKNTTECADFSVKNFEGDSFDCQKVHYCNPEHDICLIEVKTKTKTKRDCFFCSGTKYDASLALGPALRLKAHYNPPIEERLSEVTTAIGNSAGFGIHYSQGQGVSLLKERIYFYAPITKGNSGGPLLNSEGAVIGVVKLQSQELINKDPNQAYNIAAPTHLVIDLLREALREDPETLMKFEEAVVE